MIDFKEEVLKHKDEMLKDLKDLCLIPSTLDKSTAKENQPFGENNRKALDLMLSIGQRDGFVTDDCDGYAGSIDIGEGEDCFGILGHLDVVPTEGQEWDYPEYDMTLDGDTLYGRGVADDKGPLIAAYYAAKIVNELDFEKKMKVRIIFGCNEENGSRCMHYYFQHRPYPKMGFTPDADFPVVYGEKGNCHFIIKGKTDDDKVISIHSGRVVNIVPDQAKAVLKGTDYEESYNAFLKENNFFGYDENKVKFFKQGKVPMVKEDGNIIIDQNKLIKEASDGNGSIYKSLKDSNLINQMKEDGIEWIFVGGVDNILLKIVDPVLTGLTITENNLISSKSVVKKNAKERVGVFCKLNGVPKVIEYTELPEKMAEEIDSNGQLMYGEVNILSHLFNIKALEKLSEVDLPYHTAYKKSNYLDEKGNFVEVTTPNAYKFEAFLFDAFESLDDMAILRVKREEEFAPVKNAEGVDSPETARKLYKEFHKIK